MRCLLAAIFLLAPAALGQAANPDSSPNALIQNALARYNANKHQAYAFTYIELWHNQNFSHGKLKTDESAKFESIFIEDLPYLRKIEENGKPLTAGAAREEEEKYEAAVKARRGMTLEQKQEEMQTRNLTFPIHLSLIPALYDNRIVGTENLNGRPSIHIDCVPRTGITPKNHDEAEALRVHVQIWIDVQDQIISRFDGKLIREVNGMMPGSEASASFVPIDGVWLPLHSVVCGRAKNGKFLRLKTEISYSDFRRFRVDVHVLDGNQPDDLFAQ
jgi:hypothetical protein